MNRRQVFGMFAGLAALPAMGFNWTRQQLKHRRHQREWMTFSFHEGDYSFGADLHTWIEPSLVDRLAYKHPPNNSGAVIIHDNAPGKGPRYYNLWVPAEFEIAERKLREFYARTPSKYIELMLQELQQFRPGVVQ